MNKITLENKLIISSVVISVFSGIMFGISFKEYDKFNVIIFLLMASLIQFIFMIIWKIFNIIKRRKQNLFMNIFPNNNWLVFLNIMAGILMVSIVLMMYFDNDGRGETWAETLIQPDFYLLVIPWFAFAFVTFMYTEAIIYLGYKLLRLIIKRIIND